MMDRDYEALRQLMEPVEEVPPMPADTHARWRQAVHGTQQAPARASASWKRMLATAAAAVFVLGGTALTRDSLPNNNAASDSAADYLYGVNSAAYSYEESAAYDAAPVAAAGGSRTMLTSANGAAQKSAAAETRKLIRTVDMTLGTRTYDASLAALTEACTAAGGWVESLSENSGDKRIAYLTLRIPAGALEDFLGGTESWGRIIRRSENTQDVTESYQDTQSRLATQQALMDRLQALVTDAADLTDLLALEAQIADTQYEIDRLTGMLLSTDRQVDYATVSVTLKEEAVNADTPDLTLWQRITGALATGCEFVIEWTKDTIVFLAGASPVIAIAGVVVLVARRLRRKR